MSIKAHEHCYDSKRGCRKSLIGHEPDLCLKKKRHSRYSYNGDIPSQSMTFKGFNCGTLMQMHRYVRGPCRISTDRHNGARANGSLFAGECQALHQ